MRRLTISIIAGFACVVAMPAFSFAQASLAGTVTDSSGAFLPGVTVEATSPALIEKIRSVATDSTGQYRIVDLRPGAYTLTFTLSGFRTVRRDGIALTGSFTATVDAELQIGAVTETINVVAESPIVDVQNGKREVVLDGDIVRDIPTSRAFYGIAQLIPGVTLVGTTTGAGGGSLGPIVVQMASYGGTVTEGVVQVNGNQVRIGLGGGSSFHNADVGNAEEVAVSLSGRLGESESAGPILNIVPKTGGNVFAGSLYVNGANEQMAGRNVDDKLAAFDIREGVYPLKIWEINPTLGGPIMHDRLWFFGGYRNQGLRRPVPGLFTNANAGDPSKWYYTPTQTPAKDDGTWTSKNLRVTWQATPRNNFQFAWDRQYACTSCKFGGSVAATSITSPEAAGINGGDPQDVHEASWRSPVTNRLLLDGGFSTYLIDFGFLPKRGESVKDLVRITEQCTVGCAINGGRAVNYRSMSWGDSFSGTWSWRASASYITGAHSVKTGYFGNVYSWESVSLFNSTELSYRVNNGIPNQLTYHANHGVARIDYVRTAALYVQDQWRVRRLTLQGAVRYDRAVGWYPAQTVGPNRFFPTAATLEGGDNVTGYNDVTPRFGAAYDLFGNGKTSLKFSGGRYLEQAQASGAYARNNPMALIALSNITRQWTDSNGNWEPDCDLLNLQAQNNVARGGDICGQISNLAFGTVQPTSAVVDPDLFGGWGVRQSDWQFSMAVQQEIFPRASVEVAYVRRNFSGFTVTDNLATTAADYTPFSIITPSGAPGGGGRQVDGLFNVVPSLQSAVQTRTVRSDKLAAELGVDDAKNHFNSIDVNFKFRLTGGLAFQGGTSTGQEVADVCALRSTVPELGGGPISVSVTNPYCHQATGFTTQVRGLATYVIPRIDIHVSGTLRSDPGFSLQANHTVTNADCLARVTCTLGRAFSGTSTNIAVPILEPNAMRGDRVTNVDFHISKILRFAGKRTNVGVDVFNLTNANSVQGYSNNFVVGQPWPAPTAVMPARYVKLSLQFDY